MALSVPMNTVRHRPPYGMKKAIGAMLLAGTFACTTWQRVDVKSDATREAPVRVWWAKETAAGVTRRIGPDSLFLYVHRASEGCLRCERGFALANLDSVKVKRTTAGGTALVVAAGAIGVYLFVTAASLSGME